MLSYLKLMGFDDAEYRRQMIRFIPVLDRAYLKDFYDRAESEMSKHRGGKSRTQTKD